MMPDGKYRELHHYLWSCTFLKRGGALENSVREVWALTDAGEKITTIDETRAVHKYVNAEERNGQSAFDSSGSVNRFISSVS